MRIELILSSALDIQGFCLFQTLITAESNFLKKRVLTAKMRQVLQVFLPISLTCLYILNIEALQSHQNSICISFWIQYIPQMLTPFGTTYQSSTPVINQMNDINKLLHYRYNAIVKDPDLKQSTKTRWSCNLKDKRIDNKSLITKYKSIRELKKEIDLERNYTQRKPDEQNPYLNRFDKEQLQAKNTSYELVEIVKMKLYKNGTDKEKVKTECTINRRELHQLLKKKKSAQFTSSRSLESFKRIYPKKIDIFMNNLRMKVSAIEEQKTIDKDNKEEKKQETIPLLRKGRIAVREWAKRAKAKPSIKIETPKIETKPLRFVTEYDGEEVSGWEVETMEENYSHNHPALMKRIKFQL